MTKEKYDNKELIKWLSRNRKKKNRDNNLNTFGTLFGYIFLNLILFTQFVLGPFRFYSFAELALKIIAIEFTLVFVFIFIKPEFTLKYLSKFMKLSGAGVTMVVVSILLGTLYVISLPFAKYFGRRKLLSKHNYILPWINQKYEWNGFASTWQSKFININKSKSNYVFRSIILFFLSEKNYFLLPIVIIIIIIASFMLIASAPVVAPFIYPL
jgi:hypothetical protein